jgi:hypothetical protein
MLYASILATLQNTYTAPVKKILERRARYWAALAEKDLHTLPKEEALRIQQRLVEIEQEVEAIQRLCDSTDEFLQYIATLEDLNYRANRIISTAQYEWRDLAKDVLTLQEVIEYQSSELQFYNTMIISLIQQHQA